MFDNLAALIDGGNEDGARALVAWVDAHRAQKPVDFVASPPWSGRTLDAREQAYVARALGVQCAELAALPPNSGRNTALYTAALKMGSYIAGAGLDRGLVVARLVDAASTCGLVTDDGQVSVDASIRSGLDNGARNPRAVPPPNEDSRVANGKPTLAESTPDDAWNDESGRATDATKQRNESTPARPGGGAGVTDAQPTRDKEPVLIASPRKPMKVARRIISDDFTKQGLPTLRRWRGGWMGWQGDHWAEVEDEEIRAHIYAALEKADCTVIDKKTEAVEIVPWDPNRRTVSDVLDAIGATTQLPERIDSPSWLPGFTGCVPANEIVACKNTLLHIGSRQLLDLTPGLFNRVAVPFDYDPDAPAPTEWLKFLDQLWPDDPESITTLAQWFGYVLSGRTDLHKVLLMIGPTRSGKGTIARVLSSLIGQGNVAGPTLASLATNFGLSTLLGKPLAIVSDARLGGTNTTQVVERLLSISGEDTINVDRKYRDPWIGKLPARFMVMSNEIPRFGDASGAISNRFVMLAMANSFLGRENLALTERLLLELPGILLWALDGLAQLTKLGRFTVSEESDHLTIALQDSVSPMSAFVRDRCELIAGRETTVKAMFNAWKLWCADNGRDHVGTVQSMGRDLLAAAPKVKINRPNHDGERQRVYTGISIRVDGTNDWPGRGPLWTEGPPSDPVRDRPRPGSPSDQQKCRVCGVTTADLDQDGICPIDDDPHNDAVNRIVAGDAA